MIKVLKNLSLLLIFIYSMEAHVSYRKTVVTKFTDFTFTSDIFDFDSPEPQPSHEKQEKWIAVARIKNQELWKKTVAQYFSRHDGYEKANEWVTRPYDEKAKYFLCLGAFAKGGDSINGELCFSTKLEHKVNLYDLRFHTAFENFINDDGRTVSLRQLLAAKQGLSGLRLRTIKNDLDKKNYDSQLSDLRKDQFSKEALIPQPFFLSLLHAQVVQTAESFTACLDEGMKTYKAILDKKADALLSNPADLSNMKPIREQTAASYLTSALRALVAHTPDAFLVKVLAEIQDLLIKDLKTEEMNYFRTDLDQFYQLWTGRIITTK